MSFKIGKSDSAVRVVTKTTGCTTEEPWFDSIGGNEQFCFPYGSRPAPGLAQSPTECVLVDDGFPQGRSGRGVKLTPDLNPVPSI